MTTTKTFFLFILHIATTTCAQTSCPKTQCPGSDIPIHFPFGLKDRIDQRCGYNPSFDLSCDDQNQTIITLPSGEFIVKSFEYEAMNFWINDPGSCLARRLLATNFTLNSEPFRFEYSSLESYIFLNCTANVTDMRYVRDMIAVVTCLSGQDYTVAAVSSDRYAYVKRYDVPCSLVSEAMVPVRGYEDPILDGGDVLLEWDLLACQFCEVEGEICGFVNDTGNDVGCLYLDSPAYQPNIPPNNKGKGGWAIVAVAILMVLFFVCFTFSGKCKARPSQTRTQQYSISLGVTVNNNNNGLDLTTIESYSKTVLRELPDPNNNTCSICLSEYRLGETVRTIPNCQHYFHVYCIDEWLRKSKTCPLCRNFACPHGSSSVNASNFPTTLAQL